MPLQEEGVHAKVKFNTSINSLNHSLFDFYDDMTHAYNIQNHLGNNSSLYKVYSVICD